MGRSRSARTALSAPKARVGAFKLAPRVGRTLRRRMSGDWLVGAPYGRKVGFETVNGNQVLSNAVHPTPLSLTNKSIFFNVLTSDGHRANMPTSGDQGTPSSVTAFARPLLSPTIGELRINRLSALPLDGYARHCIALSAPYVREAAFEADSF